MISIEVAAAVTHSGCLHFSRAPNLCCLSLYVRFILCRRYHSRDSRFQSLPAVGHPVAARHRRRSAFIQFLQIAQYSEHVSNCLAILRDNKPQRERLSQLVRLYEGPVPARHAGPREHNDTLLPVAENMLYALNPSLVPGALVSFLPQSLTRIWLRRPIVLSQERPSLLSINRAQKVRSNEGNAKLWMRADGQNRGRSARVELGTVRKHGGKGQGRKLRK